MQNRIYLRTLINKAVSAKKAILFITLLSSGFSIAATSFEDPNRLDDDVVIPMPCDDNMIFRKVYTSNGSERMKDARFTSGLSGSDSPFAQDPATSYVQGGFEDKQGFYYLMGKYEVTSRQHQELTGKCQTAELSMKDKLPAVSLSWFDAIEASRNFSKFLQGSDKLKKQFGRQIFARLPSDAEWEYAVRGGLKVSRSEFEGNLPPMDGPLSEYVWHQGAQSAAGHLNIGGRLKPNSLGLYDMLGNVQEMILEPFHAVRTGRLHGQSGGFAARGGSYLTPSSAISSALRTEKSYFNKDKELTAKDLGYRLVIGTVVANDSAEVKDINSEIAALGTSDTTGKADGAQLDNVSKLDEIIRKMKQDASKIEGEKQSLAKVNESLKENNRDLSLELNNLREQMIKSNAERDEMRDAALISNLRLGGFLCRSMADEYASYEYFKKTSEALKERCDANKAMCTSYEATAKSAQSSRASLNSLATYYGDTVSEAVSTYDARLIARFIDEARKTFNQGSMPLFIDKYAEHLKGYKKRTQDPGKNRDFWSEQCHALVGSKK